MTNILIVGGCPGHTQAVIDVIEEENKYSIVGLIDKFGKLENKDLSYQIIGNVKDIPHLVEKHDLLGGIIAIGDNWTRNKVVKKIKRILPGFRYISAVHPDAQISKNVDIGAGTIVMPGVIINTNSTIGSQCLLNTNSSLDHDSYMGNFSSLAPNVATGGYVKIEKFSAISIGANIIHEIRIGKHTVIGAGALVLEDIPEFVVAYGIPAKIIRKRKKGEEYL